VADVTWITAFLDLPAHEFERTATFWSTVTESTRSPTRGDHQEFATLIPSFGDAYLRVQRTLDGHSGVHIDLHTDDIPALTRRATDLGATLIADLGYSVMRSPGSMTFCIVAHHSEQVRPTTTSNGSLVDQVALDIPSEHFKSECQFWSALTSWELQASAREEFSVLQRPTGMPIRFLLQRLGDDDSRTGVEAHIDIACGSNIDAVAAEHQAAGATVVWRGDWWTTMRDPSGAPYCLTSRDPVTGVR
jgi:hypothetical protein